MLKNIKNKEDELIFFRGPEGAGAGEEPKVGGADRGATGD